MHAKRTQRMVFTYLRSIIFTFSAPKQHIYNRHQYPGPLSPAFASRIFTLWHSHSPFLRSPFFLPSPSSPRQLPPPPKSLFTKVFRLLPPHSSPFLYGRTARCRAKRPMAPGMSETGGLGDFRHEKRTQSMVFTYLRSYIFPFSPQNRLIFWLNRPISSGWVTDPVVVLLKTNQLSAKTNINSKKIMKIHIPSLWMHYFILFRI